MSKTRKRRKVSKTLARKRPNAAKSRGRRARRTKNSKARKPSPRPVSTKRKVKAKKQSGLLAKGGGNATAAGVTFQASVGAVFATQMLTESQGDDRLGLATFRPKSIRFESDAPLDDISVETDQNGWILVQAKTKLDFSTALDSEFGKTAGQIVRQWRAGLAGQGNRGWDRPLVLEKDRLLIAVGPNTGKTITSDLAKALTSLGAHATARAGLGLDHRVPQLLENWPGKKPGYVFIDALDATRGGRGEAVFRALIQDILALPGNRWRVVASIRSFDLKLGERFRALFVGRPPNDDFRDTSFPSVRHINVPPWSETEFAELLSKAPSLATAIAQGGQKLRDLAAVPFNTRLLADLLSSGLPANAFGEIGTQVELLGIYWDRRVTPLGNAADVCLRAALEAMVTGHTLQAERVAVAAAGPSALDGLQQANVLVPVIGDRYIGFRHHILFDYAASRLFIDPLNIGAVSARLVAKPGLALMLAPALGYTLHDVWLNSGEGHPEFWSAVVELTGNSPSDPVARSVAARMASELPKSARDIAGLVHLLQSASERERAAKAFTQVVGALTVGVEDGLLSEFSPWCQLAEEAANYIEHIAWPLRTLLSQIVSKVTDGAQRNQLGHAARALLTFALADAHAAMLVTVGIDLVCETYGTDISASRALLASLMTGDRFDKHSHEDMPALARGAGRVAQHDPDFVVDIYRTIFGNSVTDTSATSMGNSRILALTSNRKQDYDHARWQLSQYVPGLLEGNPELGVRLLIAALEGLSASEHPTGATEVHFAVAGRPAVLLADHSHIWAHDPDDKYAYASNAGRMIVAFKDRLLNAAAPDAVNLAQLTIAANRLAILWSRMFFAAARRHDVFASVIWPYASRLEFLRSSDTRKDAIDAIAAAYPRISGDERRQFEDAVFAMPFEGVENPDRSRRRLLTVLFSAIGLDHLVTDAAKRVFTEDAAKEVPRDNRRAYSIFSETSPVDHYYWLTDKGIDVEAPRNADPLSLAEAVPGRPNPDGTHPTSVGDGLRAISALARALQNPPDPPPSPHVVDYAHDALLKACASLGRRKEELRQETDGARVLAEIVEPYLGADELAIGSGETSVELRASAIEATMLVAGSTQEMADKLVPSVERHLTSEHERVREEIADNLGWLWDFSRDALWRFADYFARTERAYRVLQRFTNFLCRALHHAPEKTEGLLIEMIPHARGEVDPHGDRIIEAIGNFVAILWMRYERPRSRALVTEWLADLAAHEPELNRAASSLRDTVILEYETDNPEDARLRHAAQKLANEFVDVSAAVIDAYLAMDATSRTEADHARVRAAVRLCDNVGDQLYFSSGAFRANEHEQPTGLVSIASRLNFLNEMESTLRRIGDVGTPHTIYYLVDMLQHLRPADPERVFDLVAHSLLNAGRKHGYQFEGMGNDRFVEVVGLFLADNREIFNDPARRANLIACLDAFVEAGWPKARRLLYRLPELL